MNNENVEILSFLFYRLPHGVKLKKLVVTKKHLYCISVTINVLASVHLQLFHFNQMHLSAPQCPYAHGHIVSLPPLTWP